jgi:hypothetical protein
MYCGVMSRKQRVPGNDEPLLPNHAPSGNWAVRRHLLTRNALFADVVWMEFRVDRRI